MITTIIILAYVASVFFNRWLNKLVYNIDKDIDVIIAPKYWFIPILTTIVLICEVLDNRNTWFAGKNW